MVALGLALAAAAARAEPPRVVASVKPLQSLAAGVMAGIGAPEVLIKGGNSPHSYSLRPSDARILEHADVVFWIGPRFEAFLEKSLVSLGRKARVVALIGAPKVKVLSARQGGLWVGLDTKDAARGDGHQDQHIWLDVDNAKAIVAAMATALSAGDAANAARYFRNAAEVEERLTALDAELRMQLAPIRQKPFIVFHDAYHYFEARYGLNAMGAITVSPDRAAGARRISEIRAKIESLGDVCVFSEPQFQPKLVKMLLSDTRAKSAVLDPEGTALAAGPELYFDLMRGLGGNFTRCLEN